MKPMPPTDPATATEAFARLVQILDELREKCPWDREQTLQSLRGYSIEEVYELSEALLADDSAGIRNELGDLLLHVVFYSRIAREEGRFDLPEMIHAVCEKLIRRHPHVYGTVEATTADAVADNWEKLKLKEKDTTVLGGVPNGLPALLKAYRMQEKVARVGFDWEATAHALDKVQEEIGELRVELADHRKGDALPEDQKARIEDEFGDMLFSLVNYARFIGINPEDALERANRKFKSRFDALEATATAQGKALTSLTLAELDAIWDAVKAAQRPA